jgi:hypothetical protein
MKKAGSYILKLLLSVLILGIILFILYYINKSFHIFDAPIDQLQDQLKSINRVFLNNIIAGISVGTVLLLVFIFVFPLMTKKINTRVYIQNIILGVISSFVFFVSQLIFQYFEKYGKFYMVISIASTIIITIIIVEIMSLSFKSDKKEIEFRTSVLGCIASGLIFGIVLNIVLLVMGYFHFLIK